MKRAAILAAATLLAACQSVETGPRAAVLVAPDDTVRTELVSAVSEALGTKVRLSSRALTDQPTLTIDAPSQARIENGGDQGLLMGRPDRFSLWLTGDTCALRHDQTDREWVLENARCKPVNAAR